MVDICKHTCTLLILHDIVVSIIISKEIALLGSNFTFKYRTLSLNEDFDFLQ